jgi:hypothetical protein
VNVICIYQDKKGSDIVVEGDTPAQNRIKQVEFEKLCGLQCTQEEICDFFNVDDKTLTTWCRKIYDKSFSEIFKEKRSLGKISLRRNMFKQSEKNPTMAIWLSKQHLGMKDNIEVESTQLVKVQELLNKIEEEASK